MTVCVPDPLLYGLLIAAVGMRFAEGSGLLSILRDSTPPESSSDEK